MIFAGTTEGRLLAEHASKTGARCFVSTATEYGARLLEGLDGIRIVSGRMDEKEIASFIRENGISLVIDATHPFAQAVSENIKNACADVHVHMIRCLRGARENGVMEADKDGGDGGAARNGRSSPRADACSVVTVSSVEEAVQYLAGTKGNILIATGSKELGRYTLLADYRERCFARVLSTRKAVEESAALGFEGKHLIAMQGPFSAEMNLALLRQTDARYFVTKESGKEGGFGEKVKAARQAKATLVVVARPAEDGISVEEAMKIMDERLVQTL